MREGDVLCERQRQAVSPCPVGCAKRMIPCSP